jgi:hypothetical protein
MVKNTGLNTHEKGMKKGGVCVILVKNAGKGLRQ